jgi:predicted metal-dependent HD superfamily phosphohydrolase
MFPLIVTHDPSAVEVEVQAAYREMFPGGDPGFVPRVFSWAIECFTGNYADYQAVDAHYHDLEHTLQGTLCLARLLRGRQRAHVQPALTERLFQLGLIGILLHDTGYLKKRDDLGGTGAKYTITHVHRSADFAAQLLGEKNFAPEEITAVQNMICCTGVDSEVATIPFDSEPERIVGQALATADLLGQMAAEDYVDKLPVLYGEFAEAADYGGGRSSFIKQFRGPEDLVRRTPAFWENLVLPKLEREFGGLHRFLNEPYPGGPNWYVQRIEANMERIKERIAAMAM